MYVYVCDRGTPAEGLGPLRQLIKKNIDGEVYRMVVRIEN